MAEKCWAHYESARAEYNVSQNKLEECWALLGIAQIQI